MEDNTFFGFFFFSFNDKRSFNEKENYMVIYNFYNFIFVMILNDI